MERKPIIGVMGGGEVSSDTLNQSYLLGSLIAGQGWVLLNGGRNSGVMDASARGARDHGGLTIGILPDNDRSRVSDHIQIPIVTGMGSARNAINVLSSDVVVACPGGPGTLSEIALALKAVKPVVLFHFDADALALPNRFEETGLVHRAETAEQVIEIINRVLKNKNQAVRQGTRRCDKRSIFKHM